MIHKKMSHRNGSEGTLAYIYRGDGHEHDVKECVHHIHTQGMAPNPIKRDKKGRVKDIDIKPIAAEFDFLADKNKRSDNRFSHYIISLPEGEKLSSKEWKKVAKKYMKRMGYGLDTKWTAALHDEKKNQHIHILACRVQNNPQAVERGLARDAKGKGNKPQPYPLVEDSNDHSKGMEVMRELEKELGLSVTPSPDMTWGSDLTREEFEGTINKFERTGESQAPWKSRIIARLSKAVEKSNGKTFTEFLDNVRAVGVEPLVNFNDRGFPTGISFAMQGRSAAGSKLKSTRLTFSALTGVKYDRESNSMQPTNRISEGIRYEQKRDVSACISTSPSPRSEANGAAIEGPRPQTNNRSHEEKREASPQVSCGSSKSKGKINKTLGAPMTQNFAISSKSGIDELLDLQNLYADLEMNKAHAQKMARLFWGQRFDV